MAETMETSQQDLSGVLFLMKPSGMTAHDVVDYVRKVTKIKRVGHTGTLDPLAAGLMILCLGRATRFALYLSELDKVYRFEVVFGIQTTSQDADGEVISRQPCDEVTEERVRSVLPQFIGVIEQIPPMQSALHYQGRRLYELARKGVEVPRTPRKVTIHRLELIRFVDETPKRALLEVECGRGTYIRTLASDIGKALGCGAYQHFLVRLKIGPFSLRNALTLEEFTQQIKEGRLREMIVPVDQTLVAFPPLALSPMDFRKLSRGSEAIVGTVWGHPRLTDRGLVRLYGPGRSFLGIGQVRRRGNLWICQPRTILASPS
ncbi:MAG: tRNA pseudouridine(55) synthase TruB [Armatimonadetes bacterium]|nr:tRNA pseudouridine(55) synthase TruB [Armatimonadota bacterium]MDW8122340.1 tRNA pseudouridine(55) synthase TruB [Armatimonadota bacterium]